MLFGDATNLLLGVHLQSVYRWAETWLNDYVWVRSIYLFLLEVAWVVSLTFAGRLINATLSIVFDALWGYIFRLRVFLLLREDWVGFSHKLFVGRCEKCVFNVWQRFVLIILLYWFQFVVNLLHAHLILASIRTAFVNAQLELAKEYFILAEGRHRLRIPIITWSLVVIICSNRLWVAWKDAFLQQLRVARVRHTFGLTLLHASYKAYLREVSWLLIRVLFDLKVKVGCVGIKLVRTFLILCCHRLQSLQIRKGFALFFLAEQCIRSRSSLMAVLMTHFVYSQQTALTALKLRSHFVHELLRFNLAYSCRHRNNDGIFFHLFAWVWLLFYKVDLDSDRILGNRIGLLISLHCLQLSLGLLGLHYWFGLYFTFFKIVSLFVNQPDCVFEVVYVSHHSGISVWVLHGKFRCLTNIERKLSELVSAF